MKNSAYKIIVSPKAQIEIEKIVNYYSEKSEKAPLDFIISLENSYNLLKINPFFRIRYRNVRALKINKFPYSLFFVIEKEKSIIRVLSCFHNKRNPTKTNFL
jgi:plasmid stabilization system protein ParE